MTKFQTAIAGSFKFKNEIDYLHEEFADFGVDVLEPTKGWLYLPAKPLVTTGFRPLPAERNMAGPKEIEARFLAAIRRCDFMYLYNPSGYLGLSSAFEVGYAIGKKVPIFANEEIPLENLEYDLAKWHFLKTTIRVASPADAAMVVKNHPGLHETAPA